MKDINRRVLGYLSSDINGHSRAGSKNMAAMALKLGYYLTAVKAEKFAKNKNNT